jgi:hypothetical protein
MSKPLTASEILDREFLELRAKILQVAAAFDRLDRAEGDVDCDSRLNLLREGIDILSSPNERAEQFQLLFSRPYEDDWQTTYDLAPK